MEVIYAVLGLQTALILFLLYRTYAQSGLANREQERTERLLREGKDDSQRLTLLFTLLASREPTDPERTACTELLEAMHGRYSNAKEDAVALLSIGDATRDEKLDPAIYAAWTQVAVTVLASDVAILLY